MSRRVVVTGVGAVTPVGNDVATMWKNMLDGVCGIDKITKFSTDDLTVKIAGEVKDFDPTSVVEKRDIRKTDMYTIFALAAAKEAVEDSGIIGTVDEKRLGSYIGCGIGGLYSFVENTQAFLEKGRKGREPFGYVGLRFGFELCRRGVPRRKGRLRRRCYRGRRRVRRSSADYRGLLEYEGSLHHRGPEEGFDPLRR